MNTDRIDPEVIETATNAILALHYGVIYSLARKMAEAAIRAAFDELGIREQRRAEQVRYDGFFGDGEPPRVPAGVRYISDWRSVEREQ